jgi:hypothetical protein
MANIHDCLARAVEAGELNKEHAEAAASEFDQLVARYEQAMPRHQAEVSARANLKEATSKARRSRRHMVLNQLQTLQRIKALLTEARDPSKAILDMFETTPNSAFKGENVRFIQEAIQARMRHDMQEFLEKAGVGVTGRSKDPALMRDVMRELHDQSTESANAKEFADAIRKVKAWLRQTFNAHGGDIGEIADHGARHSHDARKIEDAGFKTWKDAIYDSLDWSRITDLSTGKPFAVAKGARPYRAEAEAFLQQVYDNITSNGWKDREPSMSFGGKALYNKNAEPRLLHFTDGDAWMDYNAEFGTTDPFTALVGGMDALARDISLMKVFGPNPNAGMEFAIQTLQKRVSTSGNPKLKQKVDESAKRARVLMNHATGAINQAESEFWGRAMSTVRHINVSTKLGSAVVSAVSDLATLTAGSVAMGRNPANMLSNAVSMVFANGTRKSAARMGFTAETLLSMMSSSARLTNDEVANDWASRLSGFTIRASGLSRWTDGMRLAVQMENAGHLADNVGRGFDDLDVMIRKQLERHGITARDWQHLSDPAALFDEGKGDFLTPFWWLEHQTTLPRGEAEGLALRLQASIQDQVELFVPSKRMRATAAFINDSRPGTLGGEFLRSTIGFKNYALSLSMGQIHLFNALPTPQTKAAYLVTMAASTLIMGALAIQLKEMVKGRDPQPMDTPKFWFAAQMQGGGLGIFGDFVFAEKNRFGGGLAQTAAGPVVGLIGDAARIPASNFNLAVEGKDTKFGRDVANFLRYNTPVASSLWPSRVAFDRLVFDQIQMMLDPEAEAQMRRAEQNQIKNRGNASWWARGTPAPSRAPDLSNAIGGQ